MTDLAIEIDQEKFILLEAVARATESLAVPWILAGAGGRVLLLEKVKGLPPGRATEDLDFGVMVRSWEEYQALRNLICKDGRFRESPKLAQRLLFGDSAMLDLVPFGPIGKPEGSIRWPPGGETVMNVLGFQEACDTAEVLLLNGRLHVPVATPQAMLVLKFSAWEDRHLSSPGKDAPDIAYVLYYGERIIGKDELYDQYERATEAVGWDLELASARAFGILMDSFVLPATRGHLEGILARELADGDESALVREIANSFPSGAKEVARSLGLLRQVQAGLAERPASGV